LEEEVSSCVAGKILEGKPVGKGAMLMVVADPTRDVSPGKEGLIPGSEGVKDGASGFVCVGAAVVVGMFVKASELSDSTKLNPEATLMLVMTVPGPSCEGADVVTGGSLTGGSLLMELPGGGAVGEVKIGVVVSGGGEAVVTGGGKAELTSEVTEHKRSPAAQGVGEGLLSVVGEGGGLLSVVGEGGGFLSVGGDGEGFTTDETSEVMGHKTPPKRPSPHVGEGEGGGF
jgi:hypothetical protein